MKHRSEFQGGAGGMPPGAMGGMPGMGGMGGMGGAGGAGGMDSKSRNGGVIPP